MTATKLPGWIATVFLCLCVFSFSGCSGTSEQRAAYKKAEAAEYKHNYEDAALLFESAGEYKDAKQKSRDCWHEYIQSQHRLVRNLSYDPWEMLDANNLRKILAAVQNVKTVLERLGYTEQLERMEAKNREIEIWIAVQAEQAEGNDEKAIALLETMALQDKNVKAVLEIIRTKDERQRGVERLREYLKGVPESTFVPDEKLLFYENLEKLFQSAPFNKDEQRMANALVAMRCSDIIASAWNNHGKVRRKLSFMEGPTGVGISNRILIFATIQLVEAGDEFPEVAEILALVHAVMRNPDLDRRHPGLMDLVNMLELYNGGAEWVEKFYPQTELDLRINNPIFMEYHVIRAPQRFKDALYNQSTDTRQKKQHSRIFRPGNKSTARGFCSEQASEHWVHRDR